jgi:hypothetical protein
MIVAAVSFLSLRATSSGSFCNECDVLVRTITRQQFEGGYVPEDLQLKEIESALRRHRCHAEPPRLSNTPQHALAA